MKSLFTFITLIICLSAFANGGRAASDASKTSSERPSEKVTKGVYQTHDTTLDDETTVNRQQRMEDTSSSSKAKTGDTTYQDGLPLDKAKKGTQSP